VCRARLGGSRSARPPRRQPQPQTDARVETKNAARGPLLIISGENDHRVPWAIANASCKGPMGNEGVTEIVEIPNHGNALTVGSGWRGSPTPARVREALSQAVAAQIGTEAARRLGIAGQRFARRHTSGGTGSSTSKRRRSAGGVSSGRRRRWVHSTGAPSVRRAKIARRSRWTPSGGIAAGSTWWTG
jgi:hypothetical protein